MSKVIFIDAGHSQKNGDPGAVAGKLVEYKLNVAVAQSCAAYLGATYDCKPIVDTDNTIGNNCRKAKELGAAAFISVHHNAGGGDGAEVYYYPNDAKAKALATCVAAEFKAIGQNAHGDIIKASTKFGVCRTNSANNIPAILGEFAFIDSKDSQAVDSIIELKREGVAYAKGIAKFLNLSLKTATPAPVPEKPADVKPSTKTVIIKITCNKLRVHRDAKLTSKVIGWVYLNLRFELVDSKPGWYRIAQVNGDTLGWIVAKYAVKV